MSKLNRICIDCEKPIPWGRLNVQPNAIRCVSCESANEKRHDPLQYIDEGMGGTRAANKRERGRVRGDMIRRSRGG